VPQYHSWRQVAGYFDGDGNIGISDVSNRPYKISLSVVFTDQSIDQIANVRDFLRNNGVKTRNTLKTSKGTANIVVVGGFESVKKILKAMLPYLCKKENEVKAVIDYFEDRITGNELMTILRQEVEAGRRERRPHQVALNVPYTRSRGLALMKANRKARLRDAFGRFRSKVTPEDFARIREEHFEQGKQQTDLMSKYPQYSKETIRRVLGRDRGYVGVKGVGRVDTTDITLRDALRAHHRAEEWC